MKNCMCSQFGSVVAIVSALGLGACSGLANPYQPLKVEDESNIKLEPRGGLQADSHRLIEPSEEKHRIAIWPFVSFQKEKVAISGGAYRPFVEVVFTETTENEAYFATEAAAESIAQDPLHRFEVYDRTYLAPMLSERREAFDDLSDVSAIVQAGKFAEVSRVLVGVCTLGGVDQEVGVALRILDVNDGGRILAARAGVCESCTLKKLRELVAMLTIQLLAPVPAFESSGWPDGLLPGTKD